MLAFLLALAAASRAADWRDLCTVGDVCLAYPERVEQLLRALDLERPELAAVREAVENNDSVAACERLLEYYRTAPPTSWSREQGASWEDVAAAERILNDEFTFLAATDTVPRDAEGHLDWRHRGPEDDIEWALCLNRHYHVWTLLHAYRATHDKRFVKRIDEDIRDWIVASPPLPAGRTREPRWRGLEVNFRVSAWSTLFFELAENPDFRPATRLLLLTSLPQHGHYLRHFHRAGGNWLVMESAALGELALHWPEFKESAAWFAYAQLKQEQEISRQVYPDGVQHELTASYHGVTVRNFARFAQAVRRSPNSLGGEFQQQIERMIDYQARSMRPDGTNPLNNDSDLGDARPALIRGADDYDRPDWLFIATYGERGTPPSGLPSTMYPWAGQLVSRNGWDASAQWSFFDVGPWGTGHQHNDKLHLSISAHGRDLLVDSGRFAYDGALADKFRSRYACHSRGHNVILIDGRGQGPGPRQVSEPLPESTYRVTEAFDYARGECDHFDGLEGPARHTRALFYGRNNYWVVVDRIETERPRQIEVLWHFHPDCTLQVEEGSVATTDQGQGNLRLLPLGSDVAWEIKLVKGEEDPVPQGWYSHAYGQHAPSTCAIYSATVPGDLTFAWLLTTARGEAPRLQGGLDGSGSTCPTVTVEMPGGRKDRLVIPLGAGEPSVN
jgi:hypothetical protein